MQDKNNACKHDLYFKAYYNTLKEYSKLYDENSDQDWRAIIKKLIVYGVKAINTKEEPEYIDLETAEYDFQFASVIKNLMSTLTPKEFLQLYPMTKEYKGHKYGMKDYFYTKNYVKSLDQDKPIGEEILNFIWEYHNWELTDFNVEVMEYISRIRRLEGQTSLGEEFANKMGLKIYTVHTDQDGTKFIIDNETGKTMKLSDPKVKHLKLMK
ncbi:hypothetical protein [Clostridium sp. OS1-26]|uniref:hypothetical protein n=1 Tax=Clostridium sp. OS1-26 TaxID=3070681 RepID=UPI0027E0B4B8|nr:hypothetical protein [Clostridium sp. OS1-26]WML35664.1 hypothetical protein RCG18_02615 [Clostridium sp. OS1-26]